MVIDADNNLIIRKAIGRITLDDIAKSNEETPGHPHFHPGMNVIWDLTQADVGHFSTLELKTLSHLITEQVPWRGSHYKLAIAAPKEMDFIVSSTFSIIGQIERLPIDVRVFQTFRKAFEWSLSREPVPAAPAKSASR
jgi:hypothetical protein